MIHIFIVSCNIIDSPEKLQIDDLFYLHQDKSEILNSWLPEDQNTAAIAAGLALVGPPVLRVSIDFWWSKPFHYIHIYSIFFQKMENDRWIHLHA